MDARTRLRAGRHRGYCINNLPVPSARRRECVTDGGPVLVSAWAGSTAFPWPGGQTCFRNRDGCSSIHPSVLLFTTKGPRSRLQKIARRLGRLAARRAPQSATTASLDNDARLPPWSLSLFPFCLRWGMDAAAASLGEGTLWLRFACYKLKYLNHPPSLQVPLRLSKHESAPRTGFLDGSVKGSLSSAVYGPCCVVSGFVAETPLPPQRLQGAPFILLTCAAFIRYPQHVDTD